MYLPFVLKSDLLTASKQRLVSGCFCQVELLPQLSLSDDFTNLNSWIETDSGSNVNLSNGVVTFQGNALWNTNGIVRSSGVALGIGYFEIKFSMGSTLPANGGMIGVLPNTTLTNNTTCLLITTSVNAYQSTTSGIFSTITISGSTYYTFRIYYEKSIITGDVRRLRFTILGGSEYQTETVIGISERTTNPLSDPSYFFVQRLVNNASLLSVKEYREYFGGYPTDSPPVKFVADAGSGLTWENFDLSSLAFPSGFSNANATIKWAFHDDATFTTRTMSNALTLAQLNALGKQTARKRFAEIWVLQNSDGATQSLATELNASNATDSGGGSSGSSNYFNSVFN